ncbi:MAG: TIGR00282 family metallophosphoesterase [Solirubrobacterales bacterium]
MRILFVGDVVGKPGRRASARALPGLRSELSADALVVNGENTAGGVGVTPGTARELFDLGVDVITLGNHTYRHRDIFDYLDSEPRIIRPANYPASNPGRGETVVELDAGRLAVGNLMGSVNLEIGRSPFLEADAMLSRLEGRADVTMIDFHAEVTSEKVALGWFLDGRVAAVVGTHTHVPTADGRVLPQGTAHITDVGMTGVRDSVIGVRPDQAVERFRTQLPIRYEGAEGEVWINAVLIETTENGLAASIEQVLRPVPED